LGISDVGNAFTNAKASWILADDVAEYASSMGEVYQSGTELPLPKHTPLAGTTDGQ
jgi:hypothetical protein